MLSFRSKLGIDSFIPRLQCLIHALLESLDLALETVDLGIGAGKITICSRQILAYLVEYVPGYHWER